METRFARRGEGDSERTGEERENQKGGRQGSERRKHE